jgi:hypothetical protein
MTEPRPPDGQPSYIVQIVTANGGFAYGVIHGDLHIFGDRSPVYVLENWRPPKPPEDPSHLRRQPSRMLNARYGLVDFTGRADDVERLTQWLYDGPRLAAKWLYGPGGQGKTRLAHQVAAQAAATGWKVVTATHTAGVVIAPPGSQDLRLTPAEARSGILPDGAAGLLLIVDYADRWPLAHLTWLFSNSLLHQVGVRTRILLIARTADALPAVRGALANHDAETTGHRLEPLPESEARTDMFGVARDRFASLYEVESPEVIDPPGSLDAPEMGLTLAVHMAALVAVDAFASGRRAPPDMLGLSVYLLDREHVHWGVMYADGTRQRTFVTPPAVMNRAVFTAALTGPLSRPMGTGVVRRLELPLEPDRVLADHANCYPPANDSTSDTVLEPLYPDRLAEDFLALTLPGHRADYPDQPWAVPATDLLLGSDREAYLSRALTFLATAAQRWPHLTQGCLDPMLRRDPRLAVDAGSAAMTALAAIPELDIAVLEGIEPLLPMDRHVDLDVGAAAISGRLTEHRLSIMTEPAPRAVLHLAHGTRLSFAGREAEALASHEEGARIFRELHAAEPAWVPLLAGALQNLANRLSSLGRRAEAVEAAQEAVGLFRTASGDDPVHEPDLAAALTNLGSRLSDLGRDTAALAAAEESVALYRKLAEADPEPHMPGLAGALNNLGNHLSDLDRDDEALAAIEESADAYRALAETNPATHLPDFAGTLINLNGLLLNLNRNREALVPAQEAVTLARKLTEANPDAYRAMLVESLVNLSHGYSALTEDVEALTAAEEAVANAKKLYEATPAAHASRYALALMGLGSRLSRLNRREEAVAVTGQAVELYRRLAEAGPDAHLSDLAGALLNHGNNLSGAGRDAEALTAAEETVAAFRRLAETNPGAHRPDLAHSLVEFGNRLFRQGRSAEGVAPAREAVAIYRELADARPHIHLPHLARSLNALGVMLTGIDQPAAALEPTRESVALYRRLAETDPAQHLAELAGLLVNLGDLTARTGDPAEALALTQEGVTLFRRLAETNPDAHRPGLAQSLSTFANVRARMRRDVDGAMNAVSEAIHIYTSLAEREPEAYAYDLEYARGVLSNVLDARGHHREADKVRQAFGIQEGPLWARIFLRTPWPLVVGALIALIGLATGEGVEKAFAGGVQAGLIFYVFTLILAFTRRRRH